MAFATFTLTGTYTSNNQPCEGYVTASASTTLVDTTANEIVRGKYRALIDVDGHFSLVLPTVDDVYYTIEVHLTNIGVETHYVEPGSEDSVFDMSDLIDFTPTPIPITDATVLSGLIGSLDVRVDSLEAGGGGGGAITSVNAKTGVVVLTQDDIGDGTTKKGYTATEKTKLAGIATGATANSPDATLEARANHTGSQTASTISDFNTAADARVTAANKKTDSMSTNKLLGRGTSGTGAIEEITLGTNLSLTGTTLNATGGGGGGSGDMLAATYDPTAKHTDAFSQDNMVSGTTNKNYTATEQTKLAGIATAATANSSDATLLNRANHTGTQSADTLTDGTTNKAFLATERTKLTGVATSATANSSDATLLNRANHTGTQTSSTISNFSTSVTAALTAATTTASGIVELATSAETTTGTDTVRAITPKGLADTLGTYSNGVLVWRYVSGAYPTLPTTAPAGVVMVQAIGPTAPGTVPSWIGTGTTSVPSIYTYAPLT